MNSANPRFSANEAHISIQVWNPWRPVFNLWFTVHRCSC